MVVVSEENQWDPADEVKMDRLVDSEDSDTAVLVVMEQLAHKRLFVSSVCSCQVLVIAKPIDLDVGLGKE
ncbi:hypothetical protein PV325_006968 [Microctonus aethiopoides]|nr:hypothetical protein PV325_006968 [Microctonus aethiopoides]